MNNIDKLVCDMKEHYAIVEKDSSNIEQTEELMRLAYLRGRLDQLTESLDKFISAIGEGK